MDTWQVWWINASSTATLAGGMLEVLYRLDAPDSVIRAVQEGAPVAMDRAWEVLARERAARRCLLVFDNADDPEVLGFSGHSPSEGTGWLRPEGPVLQIVTTRHSDPMFWGVAMHMRLLGPLDDVSGADALRDLASRADDDDTGAVSLAHRLGGLPLALHLAGTYLGSSFARWHSFSEYMSALDSNSAEFVEAVADLDDAHADPRSTVAGSWELSVNALADRGVPQARPLLYLLACFEPATAIPGGLLQADRLSDIMAPYDEHSSEGDPDNANRRQRLIRQGLQGLAKVGLIGIGERSEAANYPSVTVHPIISDINRASLLTINRSDLTVTGRATVGIVNAATRGLDPKDPGNWADWRAIVPHLSALLAWLAPVLETNELGTLLQICNNACTALIWCGSWNEAENLARASERAAARLGADSHDSLLARHALAAAIAQQGKYAQAETTYREILADQRRILGSEHPDTLRASQQLAWVIGEQGRFQEAELRLRETLTVQAQVLGDDHSDTLVTRHDLDWAIAGQGRYQEAEQLCRQVLAAMERVSGREHPDTLGASSNLVWMIAEQGRYHEAEQMGRALLEDKQRVLGADHPQTLQQARVLALAILHQNRKSEAEELLRRTLTLQERSLGPTHAETSATRAVLASIIMPRHKTRSPLRIPPDLPSQLKAVTQRRK
jgi:tetratricopeptide (TPR) repeat protein